MYQINAKILHLTPKQFNSLANIEIKKKSHLKIIDENQTDITKLVIFDKDSINLTNYRKQKLQIKIEQGDHWQQIGTITVKLHQSYFPYIISLCLLAVCLFQIWTIQQQQTQINNLNTEKQLSIPTNHKSAYNNRGIHVVIELQKALSKYEQTHDSLAYDAKLNQIKHEQIDPLIDIEDSKYYNQALQLMRLYSFMQVNDPQQAQKAIDTFNFDN